MNKFTQLLLGAALFSCLQANAQRDYRIFFQSGIVDIRDKQVIPPVTSEEFRINRFGEAYYLILQFADVPDAAMKKKLKDRGVELLGYLPNYAWWARVPAGADLAGLSLRAVISPRAEYKLAASLPRADYPPPAPGGRMVLRAFPFPGLSPDLLEKQFTSVGMAVERSAGAYLQLRVNPAQMLALAAHPAIMYLEAAPSALLPEDDMARSLHVVQPLSHGPGDGLDGSGQVIAIADDGIAVHPDLQNRVIPHLQGDHPDHHSDMVTGIGIGAGNIDPTVMGMAPGAVVHLFDIGTYDHINQAPGNYESFGATITSTSYGEGCGGFYGASAGEIDGQVRRYPFLFHCFSAGNEAAQSCSVTYGGLRDAEGYAYGNLTGGQKAAKNVVAVGNLYYNDQLMRLSSRGPAEDGRIKPDICAFGQGQRSLYPSSTYRQAGGSSAAAPLVAGAAAVLSQLYTEQEQAEYLPSDLLKAVMLNTAEDLGLPGPDYKHGWGRLQVQRAAEILRERQYQPGSVGHGQEISHQIYVPNNVLDLRIMLYWHDPAANAAAGKALVNDLDLVVQPAAGAPIRPWILSTAPDIDSLNKPAYRGADRVNNVEQVSIAYPRGGNYQILIKGHLVPEGPQSYYIVYSYRNQALELTYPSGGECFTPGEKQTIRWESFGMATPLTLEYRIQGDDWKTIAANVSPSLRHFNWYVPTRIHGLAEMRIRNDNHEDVSDQPFSILAQPEFNFIYQTDRSAWMRWAPVAGADSYDVYLLGERYMEPIGTTEDTLFLLNTHPDRIDWYSVRARNNEGVTGRRAIAKRYLHLPCETTVRLQFQFDAYPGEIRWELQDETGLIVASGGPYDEGSPNSQLEIAECIPFGCYDLIVFDSYGDGLCCQGGQGSYTLTGKNGQILAAGDRFTYEDRTSFCIASPAGPTPADSLKLEVMELSHVSCHGGADGRITVQATGGKGNYTFQWSNGQRGPLLQNVAAGLYSVTIADGRSSRTHTCRIDEPTALSLAFEVLSDNCAEGSSGQVTAVPGGGTAPYRYFWSNGQRTPAIGGLAPGLYGLTLTDANGCETTGSATVEPGAELSLNLKMHQPRCPGDANGRVIAELSGGLAPYRYQWSTGDSTVSLTQLPPGSYDLTVTDASGCFAVAEATLLPPIPMLIDALVVPVTDEAPGRIDLQVSGGMPTYRYQWADGPTTASRSVLAPGEYAVTVTDYKGCIQVGSFVVVDQRTTIPPAYCAAGGKDSGQEWIESISINNLSFVSGNNQGYKSYIDRPVAVASGRSFSLVLRVGRQSASTLHYWRVWIDFNQNGRWDDSGELVFQSSQLRPVHEQQINIPAGLSGRTRMRIAMQWGVHPGACGIVNWGEVEDYTLEFTRPESLNAIVKMPGSGQEQKTETSITLFPNPARNFIHIHYQQLPVGAGRLFLLNNLGQIVATWPWREESENGNRRIALPLNLPPGIYYVRLQLGAGDYAWPLGVE